MSGKEELLEAFDEVWSRKWESLQNVLHNVTEEEALFQSPIYAEEEFTLGEEYKGTILWFLQHLAQCYIHYRLMIEQRPAETHDPELPASKTLEQSLTNLLHNRKELRNCLSELNESELDEKIFNGLSVRGLIRLTIRHDAWHSGQIAVARRLYKFRENLLP
jgi:hypothetical protein